MGPLEGVRVVDFGIITAGASTSAILADLGAEVIKVEGPDYIDPFRYWAGQADDPRWWDHSPHFRFTNRGKRGLCVDLKSAEGRRLLLDLVAVSDIVVENFRVGVMERLGVGFPALVAVNPRVVLGSVSSQGVDGPDALAVSFGSTLEASSGMASFVRYPGGDPQVSGQALNYPDQVASLFAAGMLVAALIDARRDGLPAHVDLSQRELSAYFIGESILCAAQGGDPYAGPRDRPLEGLFRSADGRWLAVTVERPETAERLGAEGLSTEPEALAAWVAARPAEAAAGFLRARGAAAEPVRRAEDMAGATGPGRGLAVAAGPDGEPVKGLPWTLDGAAAAVRGPAPTLGGDNRAIVVELLGRDPAEYEHLVAAGVLADAPRRP
ncbi:benzylsuccinate CoA-transferase BbsF subunit [Tistlia consotensis]|uniref:Benzylsuccinate CoA-transferase BbsF subunit n=1 Tax=Tistlia consotensis USBA 355 TaxID=560819 RepID=A0A1Y6BXU4_9PROT|nr:CoA transferase [Tistlia consotensis]SMF35466.1 benzylsuccinate CoA-transferase BbsF subunit [Tistlia consotensis USBA 355]SNR70758.1 benzylsuccinate CoA-transferase BbsF subunit [Tistlia consotensis]